MATHNYFPILPMIATIMHLLLLISSYVLGVYRHITNSNKNLTVSTSATFFPEPSELLKSSVEGGLLTLSLCIGGMLYFAVMMLRYIQINSLYPKMYRKTNIASFSFGIIMLLGQLSIPAFSANDDLVEYETVLGVSACIYVVFACLYLTTQTHISRKFSLYHGKGLIRFRIATSIIACTCPILYIIGRVVKEKVNESITEIRNAAEWLLTLTIMAYICSFHWDFNRVRFRSYNLDKRTWNASKHEDTDASKNTSVNKGFNYVDYLRNQAKSRKIYDNMVTLNSNTNC